MKPTRPDRPRVLLVGGEGKKNIQLVKKVESFGVEVVEVWERDTAPNKRTVPKVDLILIMTDVLGHKDEDKVRSLNKSSIPIYRMQKSIESIGSAIAAYFGYEKTPGKGGKNEIESQRKKIEQAGATRPISFASWVEETQRIRGRPLTQGDPYLPMKEARVHTTWYDVWLEGIPPEDAARLGSRNLL